MEQILSTSRRGRQRRAWQPIEVDHNTVAIPLTRGFVTLIDRADLPLVVGRPWGRIVTPRGLVYAKAKIGQQTVYLHRKLLDAPRGAAVDHADRDTLNNRRSNLRLATASQNAANRPAPKHNTSGFKGVSWITAEQRWQALICHDRANHFLGYFHSAEEAARAYDAAALHFFGEFASLNFGGAA